MTTISKESFECVAITRDGEMIPFGGNFETEELAWQWLHYSCDFVPVHDSIEVLSTSDKEGNDNYRNYPRKSVKDDLFLQHFDMLCDDILPF